MFNVWNTIHPNDVKSLIEYANSQRYALTSEKQEGEAIEIFEGWKE